MDDLKHKQAEERIKTQHKLESLCGSKQIQF